MEAKPVTNPGRGNQNLLGSRRSSEDPPDDGRPRGLLTVVSNRFLVPAAYVILRRDEQVLLQLRMNTGYRDDYWATAAAGMSKQGSQGTGHQRDRGPYRQSRAAGFRASPWVVGWQGDPSVATEFVLVTCRRGVSATRIWHRKRQGMSLDSTGPARINRPIRSSPPGRDMLRAVSGVCVKRGIDRGGHAVGLEAV